MTNKYNYKPLFISCFSTIIIIQQTSLFKYYLTVIVSLRVPPLLAYDLSNFDVALLLGSLTLLPLTNLTTASLFLYNLGGIAKYCKTLRKSQLYDSLPL